MNSGEFQAHTERIERLVQRATALEDVQARSTALELLQSVMDLHGTVMAHLVELLQDAGESGRSLLAKLGKDPLICGLLVLYDLHPVDLETRVAAALEGVRTRLRKQGGSVELLGISEGVVRVKLHASGHGCGSSTDALKSTVQQAILEAAPDVVEVMAEAAEASASGFVPLTMIQGREERGKVYEESKP